MTVTALRYRNQRLLHTTMRTITIFVLITTLGLTGCSDPRVTGTVTYQDGTPLTTGTVILQNDHSQGIGELRQDGSFELYQFKPGDGLKPGIYRGYITQAAISDDEGNVTHLIPTKYSNVEESGITYDSEKDRGRLEIIIDALPPGR